MSNCFNLFNLQTLFMIDKISRFRAGFHFVKFSGELLLNFEQI